MQRRHFEFLAEWCKNLPETDWNGAPITKEMVIRNLGRALRGTNDGYREDLFLRAADVNPAA